eukprot:CAMPEP_0178986060 /NCGR_PEP_ID=MMETSP0795-20121207/2494_1 /TAXON_ID=88552 /ORGANISM="Amoebophrya sp., Strain Ameob2" /LENGTH=480 /DNA_ID=CAMNT_0020677079 /DNA_START=81 /DNA_END=1523 /DNA_ORIENTATION=+
MIRRSLLLAAAASASTEQVHLAFAKDDLVSSPFAPSDVAAEEEAQTQINQETCDCSCCGVEKSSTSVAQVLDGQTDLLQEIECDPKVVLDSDMASLHFLAKKQLAACRNSRCRAPVMDQILGNEVVDQGGELDRARFCKAECEPTAPLQGADCVRKKNRPESAFKKAFVHAAAVGQGIEEVPAASNAKNGNSENAMSLVESGRRQQMQTSASRSLKAGEEYKSEFTKALESLLEKGKQTAQTAEQSAKAATQAAAQAKKGADFAREAVKKNQEAAEVALPEIELDTRKLQVDSSNVLKQIRELKEEVVRAATEAAEDQVKETIDSVESAELATARIAALAAAEEKKKKLVDEATAAGEAAQKPYTDAQKKAADRAADYQKRGDEFAALSNQWQMESTLAVNNANQYSLLGQTHKAERAMAKAKFLMSEATGLTNTAQSLFDTAQKITDELPLYAAQASAANYHAQFMLNPDVPRPRPPII